MIPSGQCEVSGLTRIDGSQPFADWLKKLKDQKARARITLELGKMQDGNFGDAKPVGEGVSEKRINFGPGYRIYFAIEDRKLVLLLGGSTKQRQQAAINQARKDWADYKNARKGKGRDG